MVKDRVIGVAMDFSKSSKSALQWTIDNLADKGDTLYIIHVKPKLGAESRSSIWFSSGSRKFNWKKKGSFFILVLNLVDFSADSSWILGVLVFFAALIPLVEFRNREIMKQYEISAESDVLDLLETATKEKEVFFFLINFWYWWIFLWLINCLGIKKRWQWLWRYTGEMQGRRCVTPLMIWSSTPLLWVVEVLVASKGIFFFYDIFYYLFSNFSFINKLNWYKLVKFAGCCWEVLPAML